MLIPSLGIRDGQVCDLEIAAGSGHWFVFIDKERLVKVECSLLNV